MRHSFGQFMLTMLLAVLILAGGWLGICNLDLFLPSGTEGYQLHDMASLNEENFISALSAAPLSPFTNEGLPEDAVPVSERSDAIKQYHDLVSDFLEQNDLLRTLRQSLEASYMKLLSPSNREEIVSTEDLYIYPDERGTWLLMQTTFQLNETPYHIQLGLHSADGLRIFRLTKAISAHVRLSPDAALLNRASEACSSFMEYWAGTATPAEADTFAVVLDNEGAPTEYPLMIPTPLAEPEPLRTEIDGTQCHIYYPAEGGEIVIIYDFIDMHITGAAFIPQA